MAKDNPIDPRVLTELQAHVEVMKKIESGDPEARTQEDSSIAIMAQLGKLINQIALINQESINQSMDLSLAIAQFLNVLNQVAVGNFHIQASTDYSSEALNALGQGINMAVEKMEERSKLEELMKELSTPVLYAWEGVVVMPLIGTLTSNRAQEAMEKILNAITSYGAKIAIVDITGVPVIDSMVAQHLIKTVKAVKILGSDAIITGISAEVASILVKIGIEIEQFITRHSLREGLQHAIRLIEAKK